MMNHATLETIRLMATEQIAEGESLRQHIAQQLERLSRPPQLIRSLFMAPRDASIANC